MKKRKTAIKKINPLSRYDWVLGRLNFYCKWWDEMNANERFSFEGRWVRERITLLENALNAMVGAAKAA